MAQKNHRLQWFLVPGLGPKPTPLHGERHSWRPEVVLLKLKDQSKEGTQWPRLGRGLQGWWTSSSYLPLCTWVLGEHWGLNGEG